MGPLNYFASETWVISFIIHFICLEKHKNHRYFNHTCDSEPVCVHFHDPCIQSHLTPENGGRVCYLKFQELSEGHVFVI